MGFVLLFTNLLSELNCDTRLSWHRANRDLDVLCSVFVFPQKEKGGPRAACPRALVCQGLWLDSEFNISCQTSLHSVMPCAGPVTSMMSGQPGETSTRPACWGGSCRSWEQPSRRSVLCGVCTLWSQARGQAALPASQDRWGFLLGLLTLWLTLDPPGKHLAFWVASQGGRATLGRPCTWKPLGCCGNRCCGNR